MQALVDLGLLSRKPRVGTVIADLLALERIPWKIGVASITAAERGPLAFFAVLHHQIISKLLDFNCRTMTYLRRQPAHWPHEIGDFPGLHDSLHYGQLDGVIMMTNLNHDEWLNLDAQGTAVCHVGPFTDVRCGIVMDQSSFISEATQVLQEAGCRRIDVAKMLQKEGSPPNTAATKQSFTVGMQELKDGQAAAKALLERPLSERPDGIIAADDYFAMGLAEELQRAGGDSIPQIACIANRQLPLSYALPVLRWEMDINLLAERAVALIQGRLLGRIGMDCVQYIQPVAVH